MIYKTQPYKHQQLAVERFYQSPYGALFLEQGLGKSKITLDLVTNGKTSSVLILAPNGLHANWFYKEIPQHFGLPIDARAHRNTSGEADMAYCWKGPPTGRLGKEMLADFIRRPSSGTKFLLMNIEAIRTKNGFEPAAQFLKQNPDTMIVIDESTCIKNPKAQVTKAALKLGGMADRRFILTGTPMTQGPLDLFSQCKFLHESAIPFRTYTSFKTSFAIEEVRYAGPRSFRAVTGYRNLDRLTEVMQPFSLRLTKDECLDLPAKTWQTVTVEMSKQQERAYEEIKNNALTILESGDMVSSVIPLTTIMRLQQICSGFVTTDDGQETSLDCGKIPALLQIAESGQPLVIFCAFRYNVVQLKSQLEARFGPGCVSTYMGGMNNDQRTQAVTDFQSGKTRFFVTTSAGSKGLTLTKASTLIYYSCDYKLETRLQSQDRIHRIGQESKCTYIDLISPNSIEEKILRILGNKQELSDMVLDDLIQLVRSA